MNRLHVLLAALLIAAGASVATAETCATYTPTASAQHVRLGAIDQTNPVAPDFGATTYPAGSARLYAAGLLTFPAIGEGVVTRARLTVVPTASPLCRTGGEYCTDSQRALNPLAVAVNGDPDVAAFAFPASSREPVRIALKAAGWSASSPNVLRLYPPERNYAAGTHLQFVVGGTGGRAPAALLEVCTSEPTAPSDDAMLVAAILGRTPEEVMRDLPAPVIALIAGYLRGER